MDPPSSSSSSASTAEATDGAAGEGQSFPDYWQHVDSPVSKAQLLTYAGGMLAFGAVCGAAAALVVGQRPPKAGKGRAGAPAPVTAAAAGAQKVKITPSAAFFALKALAGGTALCLSGALAVRWVVYKSMGVSSIEDFTQKMRGWVPDKAKQVGLITSRESAHFTRRKMEEEGQSEEGKRVVGLFEQWFGVSLSDEGGDASPGDSSEQS